MYRLIRTDNTAINYYYFVQMRYIFLLLALIAIPQTKAQHYDIKHLNDNDGISHTHVTQVQQDNSGMIWISTWNGLNRYDGYDFEYIRNKPGFSTITANDRILNIVLDDDGHILLCTQGYKMYKFRTDTYTFEEIPESQKKNTYEKIAKGRNCIFAFDEPFGMHKETYGDRTITDIRSIFTDRQGNKWIMPKFGMYKVSSISYPAKSIKETENMTPRAFLVDNMKRYWIATKEDKAVRIYSADNKLIGYLNQSGNIQPSFCQFPAPVYSTLQSKDGTIWLGTKGEGVFRLNKKDDNSFLIKQIKHEPSDKNLLPVKDIYNIKEDSKGRLWMAMLGGGVCCITGKNTDNPKIINADNGLSGYKHEWKRARTILFPTDNIMMVGTDEGLIVADIKSDNFKDITFKQHIREPKRANSLSNNIILDMLKDASGRIFIATESGGVNIVNTEDLLNDKLEFGIVENNENPIYMSYAMAHYGKEVMIISNNKVILYNPDTKESNMYCSNFWTTKCDFTEIKPIQRPDGQWLIGHTHGVLTIDGKELKEKRNIPPLVFTSLTVQGKEKDINICQKDTLYIAPGERHFTLTYAAIDFIDNSNIFYRTKLNDNNWRYEGKNRTLTFFDLKPGEYTLSVQSTNRYGQWNDNTRQITIIVEPRIWETTFAQVIYILLFGLLIAGVTYTINYIRYLKRQRKETLYAYMSLLAINEKNAERHEVKDKTDDSMERSGKPNSEFSLLSSDNKDTQILMAAHIKAEDDMFIRRILEYIEQNIGDPDINVDGMASAACVSRSALNRKLRTLLDTTPNDLLRITRLQKAQRMLSQTELNINEIAYNCGFSDPKYFSRCFKSEFGMSPRAYRNGSESA